MLLLRTQCLVWRKHSVHLLAVQPGTSAPCAHLGRSMSHLKAAAPASKETDKGRVALAKVGRYWAGKRAPGAEFETDAAAQGHEEAFGIKQSGSDVQRTPVEAAIIVKKADPRLARLAKTDVAEARGEGRQRHRCTES